MKGEEERRVWVKIIVLVPDDDRLEDAFMTGNTLPITPVHPTHTAVTHIIR